MTLRTQLQRLDQRFGFAPELSRGDLLELQRQAAAGDPSAVDPDLARRGRRWANKWLSGRIFRRVVYGYVGGSLIVLVLFVVLLFFHRHAWQLLWPVAISAIQLIGFRRQRATARRLLAALPPQPTSTPDSSAERTGQSPGYPPAPA